MNLAKLKLHKACDFPERVEVSVLGDGMHDAETRGYVPLAALTAATERADQLFRDNQKLCRQIRGLERDKGDLRVQLDFRGHAPSDLELIAMQQQRDAHAETIRQLREAVAERDAQSETLRVLAKAIYFQLGGTACYATAQSWLDAAMHLAVQVTGEREIP